MKLVFGRYMTGCANSNAGTTCDKCEEQKLSTKEYPDHDNEDTTWLCDDCYKGSDL